MTIKEKIKRKKTKGSIGVEKIIIILILILLFAGIIFGIYKIFKSLGILG